MTLVVNQLELVQFRGHKKKTATFGTGINAIIGANGSGKTSLLEALYCFTAGRSFRTPHLRNLIQKGEDFFFIQVQFQKSGEAHTLSLGYRNNEKRLLFNGNVLPTFSSLIGLMPAVVIAPSDAALMTAYPAERRRFLDSHIAVLSPSFLTHLIAYSKALQQRNTLLKETALDGIALWEEQMAIAAVNLVRERSYHLGLLEQEIHRLHLDKDAIRLIYSPSIGEDFTQKWRETRTKEAVLGTTLYGPHRDDFSIQLGDIDGKSCASEGQKHTFALCLKLAQLALFKAHFGLTPLLCIDDFAAHLDEERRILLRDSLPIDGQVFFTSPTVSPEMAVAKVFRCD